MALGHDTDIDHQLNVGFRILLPLDLTLLLLIFTICSRIFSTPQISLCLCFVLRFSVPVSSLSQRSPLRSSGLHSLSFASLPASDGLPVASLASLSRIHTPSLRLVQSLESVSV